VPTAPKMFLKMSPKVIVSPPFTDEGPLLPAPCPWARFGGGSHNGKSDPRLHWGSGRA
jgi:hypothetical protein